MDLSLILGIVALVIAVIVLIQSRGTAFIAWAVLCLALIHVLPAVT